jgi:hypothetical protein
MNTLRDIYAQKAISQIPRLLSSQDRNQFSPTYGCMNREYWLCRSTDFPNSIAQFGVHALALVYSHEMPGNQYYQHPKVLEWTLAGMDYWTKIQHGDGSFDEFYPNERGWAGPTGFLLYIMCNSYHLLKNHIPSDLHERLLQSFDKAAHFLAKTDESGVLANHHAMAILPMVEANTILQDSKIAKAIPEKIDIFFSYCHDEGWCLEYDGADPGYLSATVSFIAKTRKHYDDERFLPYLKKWIEFSSYFVYPNGHYAGTAGSRQTLHFYPHGYEIFAQEIPLAGSIANRMLEGLRDGALVPPEIQGERYFVYRIPELLLSYIDYTERTNSLPALPYEREPFSQYFPGAKVHIQKTQRSYTVTNAAKGGVVKYFDTESKILKVNNCGVFGKLSNKTLFTSQWIDDNHSIEQTDDTITIQGNCHKVPTKIFTPIKFIIFRIAMLMLGWHEKLAYHLKGLIRKLLMIGSKPLPVKFKRVIRIKDDSINVETTLSLTGDIDVVELQIGDEFPARYVPQSRYFQPQELDVSGITLSKEQIDKLNQNKTIQVNETFDMNQSKSVFAVL